MTLFVAWLALAISICSLAWQVTAWLFSAGRVVVRVAEHAHQPEYAQQGAITLYATNIGRGTITVNEFGFEIAPPASGPVHSFAFGIIIDGIDPRQLAPGEEYSARMDLSQIQETINRDSPGSTRIRAYARVGTKRVFQKHSHELPERSDGPT